MEVSYYFLDFFSFLGLRRSRLLTGAANFTQKWHAHPRRRVYLPRVKGGCRFLTWDFEPMRMGQDLLETSCVTWGEMVGNGRRLVVPPFQRDYAWELENWEDLWSDLLERHRDPSFSHYMGSIVLKPEEERRSLLIDGQQRLATLSLLALAVIQHLARLAQEGVEPDANRERVELLQNQYLGSKDPASLIHDWKLTLNRHCNQFYRNYLLTRQFPTSTRGLSSPERLLLEAYRFFHERIQEESSLCRDGQSLAHFLNDTVALKTVFIQVKVQNEVNAYTVFETLNARGTELTPTDLIKNYLFSLIPSDSGSMDYVETRWQNIGQRVGLKNLPEFVRHYVNSTRKLVRADRLFRELKQELTNGEQVLEFLPRLEREAEVYEALHDPESERWRDDERLQKALGFLELISIKQILPVLLAACRLKQPARLAGIVKTLGVFMFRYSTVGQKRNHDLEPLFSRLAVALHEGRVSNATSVQRMLLPHYPSDDEFRNDFAHWSIALSGPKKRLVKYVLAELEGFSELEHLTIEHILPASEGGLMISRLGNYALIEKKLNREAGGLDFARKLKFYQQSASQFTARLGGEMWGFEQIEAHQQALAECAVRHWSFETSP